MLITFSFFNNDSKSLKEAASVTENSLFISKFILFMVSELFSLFNTNIEFLYSNILSLLVETFVYEYSIILAPVTVLFTDLNIISLPSISALKGYDTLGRFPSKVLLS